MGKLTPNRYQQSEPKPILHHNMQRILVSYNNRKKHGAHSLLNKTCEGAISSNGQVVLFSNELSQKGFHSLIEMHNVLGEYGDVVVDYVDKNAPATMPDLSLLSKIVLRDLIQTGFMTNTVHDLIWYYASKYEMADAESEIQALMKWLEESEKA